MKLSKLLVFLLVCLSIFLTTDLYSQNNTFTGSYAFPNKFSLEYERAILKRSSLTVSVNMYMFCKDGSGGLDLFSDYECKEKISGPRFIISHRTYFFHNQKKLSGIYINPHVGFGRHKLTYNRITGSSSGGFGGLSSSPTYEEVVYEKNVYEFGGRIGYQIFAYGLVVDLGVRLSSNYIIGSENGVFFESGEFAKYNKELNDIVIGPYLRIGARF